MDKKYYYIVIDKVNKTLELIEAQSCEAVTIRKYFQDKGIKENPNFFMKQFSFFFNGTDDFIDLNKIYKYAKKYRIK